MRNNRVLLLMGPASAEKSELIDFFCNYFYNVDPNSSLRYHIANEKFNAQTPDRPVQCYIFNNTALPIRPIIIDTPGCGEDYHSSSSASLINKWLLENWKMRIDAVGLVFSDLHRTSSKEEDGLTEILTQLPYHVQENIVIFITASDGARTYEPLLRRFGVERYPKYTINTGCLFQKQMEDLLNDEHRKRFWKMSVNQFNTFFDKLQETTPVTISGLPYIDDAIYGASQESGGSSRNSVISTGKSTIVENLPPPPPIPPPVPPKPKRPSSAMSNASSIPLSPVQDDSTYSGIPLYRHREVRKIKTTLQTKVVSSSNGVGAPPPPQPRPPNFAPPETPPPLTESTTTPALTQAMIEQLRSTISSQYDQTTSEYHHRQSNNVQLREKSTRENAGNLENRRHSVPDDVRHYADETTPPPVVYDVADRYSTVAYMNHEPNHYVTRISTRSPSRSNIAVRDAHRLSRENLQNLEKNSPSDSQFEELNRMYSGRSAQSAQPTGDVTTRYVYDTEKRSYTTHGAATDRQSRSTYMTTDRQRWSKSSENRNETVVNDPYYSGADVTSGYGVIETRNSRTSLNTLGAAPELLHSENKYDYQPVPVGQQIRDDRFEREHSSRRSRHQSEGSRQLHIDRRVSPERLQKDRLRGSYGNVNMDANPEYYIHQNQPPPPIPPKSQSVGGSRRPSVQRINGGEVYEEERNIYSAYSQINNETKNNGTYRPIGQGVNLQPQPQSQTQYRVQTPTQTVLQPRYDQVPPDQQNSNHYIIPAAMREPGSPIQTLQPQVQVYDPYGEVGFDRRPLGLTEETTTTTTTTRLQEERRRRKKEEESRRRKQQEAEDERRRIQQQREIELRHEEEQREITQRDAELALLETRENSNYRRTYEQRKPVDNRGRNKNNREIISQKSEWKWSPTDFSNGRNCFLNVLCFVIAPLIIIGIIVVIIVFVIIQ